MKKVVPILFILVMITICIGVPFLPLIGYAASNLFVSDHSAIIYGDGFKWKGVRYTEYAGSYTEGKTLAMDPDKTTIIEEVKEDPSHIFLVKRSFLDQYLCVRNDYIIPTDGEITAVCWDNKKITDPLFCRVFSEIYLNDGETFTYETDNIHFLSETQKMKDVYLCYDGCPVGTNFAGYMGKVNDIWVFADKLIEVKSDNESQDISYRAICKIVPEEYIPLFKKHFDKR